MDKFFNRLKYMYDVIHAQCKGTPIEKALENLIFSYTDEKGGPLEICVNDENVLNLAVWVNRFLHEYKDLRGIDKIMKSATKHIDEEHQVIKETKSIKEIIAKCLIGYDNRTIEINGSDVDPYEAGKVCQSYNIDSVACYRHNWFSAKNTKLWVRNTPELDERMVIYAQEGAEAERLFRDVSHVLGKAVADERKRYGSYASRTYTINCQKGLHIRPSGVFIERYLNGFLKKHPKADIWLRTENKEVDGNGILGFMRIALEKGHEVTISYRPKETADEFYKGLEAFHYEGKPLFVKTKN